MCCCGTARRKVTCVDVGHGQLHKTIAARPEIVAMEGTDARALVASMFAAPPDLIVCDVSFISLKLVLPHVLSLAQRRCRARRSDQAAIRGGTRRTQKGILRDEARREKICRDIANLVESLGWRVVGLVASPIEGGDGNREFLIGAQARR